MLERREVERLTRRRLESFSHRREEYCAKGPDRTRRVVVVPTLERRMPGRPFVMPQDIESKSLLVAASILVRLRCRDKPPLTVMSLMMTLFQQRAHELNDLIEYTDSATFLETNTATRLIARRLFVGYKNLRDCLSQVGWNCCLYASGVFAIRGIRPGSVVMIKTDRDRELEKRDNWRRKAYKDAVTEKVDEINRVLGI